MLGLDTNVLVRYLVRDDVEQFERARQAIAVSIANAEAIFIGLVVLAETEWVLRTRYRYRKADVSKALSGLLDAAEVIFEDEAAVEEAVFLWQESSADFADCLIGAHNRRVGCRTTATFDGGAARLFHFTAL